MPPLPLVSARIAVRVFAKFGWYVARRESSHIVLRREGYWASLSVPEHGKVARGTLRTLIRTAGLTVQEFVDALERL